MKKFIKPEELDQYVASIPNVFAYFTIAEYCGLSLLNTTLGRWYSTVS